MNKKEYIDREAAKNAIFAYICGHTMSKFQSKELLLASKGGAEGAMYEIDYVPAADVAPVVHGEWMKITGMAPPEYHGKHKCSVCGEMALCRKMHEELSNYCPNCGTKMERKDHEENNT